jgi:hypothetical protein
MENTVLDGDEQDEIPGLSPQKSWVGTLCAYFRDFLDTDFRRARAPKRSITSRDASNNLTGIALSKYPDLGRDLWSLLAKPFDQQLSLSLVVRRGKYRSRISKNMNDVIQRHIMQYADDQTENIVSQLKVQAREGQEKYKDDPERFADELTGQLRSTLLLSIVNPLLGALDTVFTNQASDSLEEIFNLEEELGQQLIVGFSDGLSPAIAAALVDNNFDDLDTLIQDACSPDLIRAKFISYFEGFATNDFFAELSELRSTLRLKENFQIYIYACPLRFGSSSYPLFYFPVEVTLKNSIYTIEADPHLLVNKKAIDFAVTEIARANNQAIAFTVPERIIYLAEGDSFLNKIQSILDDFTNALSLRGAIDLHEDRLQQVTRSDIRIDNSLYFAAFDSADESLLNDYEDLLTTLGADTPEAVDFEAMIAGFMEDNPVSFDEEVDEEWRQTTLQNRLVYESPIPLNEEQRKILSALNRKDCRFIAVEGPPGTGKSHTITACVFDMILKGKNVLILSDKKEALDVAEDKIRQTLRKVRVDETLQDPILRLGKQGSSYARILSTKAINQLKLSLQVAKDGAKELERSIEEAETGLKSRIIEQRDAETTINMGEIIDLQRSEKQFSGYHDDPEELFRNKQFQQGVKAASALAQFFSSEIIALLMREIGTSFSKESLETNLLELASVVRVVQGESLDSFVTKFGRLKTSQLSTYRRLIDRLENARIPIFGYFFSGSTVKVISHELRDAFDLDIPNKISGLLPRLKSALNSFRTIDRALDSAGITDDKLKNVAFLIIINGYDLNSTMFKEASDCLGVLSDAMDHDGEDVFSAIGISADDLSALSNSGSSEIKKRIVDFANHANRLDAMSVAFRKAPVFDYAGGLEDLEHLQTQRLANTLDERVVRFANEKRNEAQQIKDIVRLKQKFPKDLFQELRTAFPVMIAGIRDYAEYVPLEQGLFDLIIIDEASQVSIAQAMPAFIRANKVVVLGDRNQFSNVKTERASIAVNRTYKALVLDQFRQETTPDERQLNQIGKFDIKTSVLDFVERIANLKIMLRKHFRGYPELIGFSSKFFYDYQLQAVKIRGKPIETVISFLAIEDDGKVDLIRNTNAREAEAIVDRLKTFAEMEVPPDCCVITPHTEQQKFILKQVMALPGGHALVDKLKLKVFTFDTCQGEERDTILYSMVATKLNDRLNYIFPRNLEATEEVEDSLRLQRLNVGFSRAKERIMIFHSKPLNAFKGAISEALLHFENTLNSARTAPTSSDVDPMSPMEARVLGWLQQVPALEELEDQVEVDAQFEIGAYLKQLDPTYGHPNYKVDFLIKITGNTSAIQIIVEYDGFKEHFTNLDDVDASNYEHYMKPKDIERQKVLEGYGYKFLRINRFNIGEDPVLTLDERLRRLIKSIDVERGLPRLIEEYQKRQSELKSGDSKVCSNCKKVKPKKDFFDKKLKKGKGGYGRVCRECKGLSNGAARARASTRAAPSSSRSKESGERIYLRCPFAQKEVCKNLGGRWDLLRKKWYVPAGLDPAPFAKWR